MIKKLFSSILTGFLISIGLFGGIIILVKAAGLTASTGTPLTADTWNTMISNFFWGSGTTGIYYNGKVGIGTSSPNKELHIKTSAGTNAELDIQSGDQPHWGIYQDETSQELRFRNSSNKLVITNGGNLNVGGTVNAGGTLNAAGGLCMNGDCKTAWSEVTSAGSNLGVYQFTGSSNTCNTSNQGKVKYNFTGKKLEFCNGTSWKEISTSSYGSQTTPGTSCADILTNLGSATNGIYRIQPSGASVAYQTYCDMTTDGGGRTIIGINGDLTSNACEVSLKGLSSCGSLSMTTDWRPSNIPTWSKFMIVVYGTDMFTDRKMYDKINIGGSNTTVSTSISGNFESSNISTEYGRMTSSLQANPIYLAQTTGCGTLDLLRICYSTTSSCYSTHETNTYGFDDYQDGCGLSDSWGSTSYRGYRSYIMVK